MQPGPGASTLACWSSAALTRVAVWPGECWKSLNHDYCSWGKRWLWGSIALLADELRVAHRQHSIDVDLKEEPGGLQSLGTVARYVAHPC